MASLKRIILSAHLKRNINNPINPDFFRLLCLVEWSTYLTSSCAMAMTLAGFFWIIELTISQADSGVPSKRAICSSLQCRDSSRSRITAISASTSLHLVVASTTFLVVMEYSIENSLLVDLLRGFEISCRKMNPANFAPGWHVLAKRQHPSKSSGQHHIRHWSQVCQQGQYDRGGLGR